MTPMPYEAHRRATYLKQRTRQSTHSKRETKRSALPNFSAWLLKDTNRTHEAIVALEVTDPKATGEIL
jgi:hypothetical protein